MLVLRREQARIGELEEAARAFVAANPGRRAWQAALATLLIDSGRDAEARALVDELAAQSFADIPQDGDWMIAITLLADVVADLRDAPRAALLYDMLAPYRRQNVVIGLAAACLGSAARYLGRLAATAGRNDQAAELFEDALHANARLGAVVELAHTQVDYAALLAGERRGTELIEAAARTADELDLTKLARRASLASVA